MNFNKIIGLFILFLVSLSCGNDDSLFDGTIVVPPQTLEETIVDNDDEIKSYLQTHFYNYEEFENPVEGFDFKIKIDTISGDNSDKVPLESQMKVKTITISSDNFSNLDEEGDVQHNLYYLEAREGIGRQATVADSTYVRYKGSLLDGTVFDGVVETPVWFDLTTVVRGFFEGVSMFKSGGEVIEFGDGTFSVEGYAVGLVIFPSGLGYFNTAQTNIPAYSPLIFEFDLFAVEETDHDQDGIPSFIEDLNMNNYLFDDDTDENGFPNYFDTDDDGDGTLTEDEDLEPDSDLNVDRDGDGDATNDIGDGNPLNDDTDGDGIPNYLDGDDTASRTGDDS